MITNNGVHQPQANFSLQTTRKEFGLAKPPQIQQPSLKQLLSRLNQPKLLGLSEFPLEEKQQQSRTLVSAEPQNLPREAVPEKMRQVFLKYRASQGQASNGSSSPQYLGRRPGQGSGNSSLSGQEWTPESHSNLRQLMSEAVRGKTSERGGAEGLTRGRTQQQREREFVYQSAGLNNRDAQAQVQQVVGQVLNGQGPAQEKAAKELIANVEHLSVAQLQALAANPNGAGIEVLTAATKHLKPEERAKILGTLRQNLGAEGAKGEAALKLATEWASDLTPRDFEALNGIKDKKQAALAQQAIWKAAESDNPNSGYALQAALGKNFKPGDPNWERVVDLASKKGQAQGPALQALVNSGVKPGDPGWDKVVNLASQGTGNTNLREALSQRLPDSPLPDWKIEHLGEKQQAALLESLKDAKEGSKLHELRQFLLAKSYADDPKSPHHKDVDPEKLKQLEARLSKDPELRRELEGMREKTLDTVFGKDREKTSQAAADYIQSPEFNQRLQLMPPEKRKEALQKELAKLEALDPKQAAKAREGLQNRATDQALKALASLPPEQREKALQEALDAQSGSGTQALNLGAGGGKLLAEAIEYSQDPKFSHLSGWEKLEAAAKEKNLSLKGFKAAMTGTLAYSHAASALERAGEGTAQQGIAAAGDLAATYHSLGELAKDSGLTQALKGKLAKVADFSRLGGFVGGMLTGTMDLFSAGQESADGFQGEANGKLLTGFGGIALGLATLFTGGTALAITGAGLALTGTGLYVDNEHGRTETQEMLHSMGVLRRPGDPA